MFIKSDWHIHSVASYDANLHLAELVKQAKALDMTAYGLTDHVNRPGWIHFLEASYALHRQYARPGFHFGVELTTISGYIEAYDRAHGTDEGYAHPGTDGVDPIAFPLTAQELDDAHVEYVIGAGHWLLNAKDDRRSVFAELHRQNLYCACSPLVDIVGHPYCLFVPYRSDAGQLVPFDDFRVVPASMNNELIAACREHDKCMEANLTFFTGSKPEAFKRDYAAFLRGAFEAGVPITIGSDCHGPTYPDLNAAAERYLGGAGFASNDFSAPRFGRRRSV